MGRQHYEQVGHGFTEGEARRNAISDAESEYGTQEGYSGAMNCATGEEDKVKCIVKPKLAKTCKVEKVVQKGARVWETVFVIKPYWADENGRTNSVELHNSTQAKAIKEAKAMALKDNKTYVVTIDKQLVKCSAQIATVSPKASQRGEWLFTGLARC
jgi:hypothetical protein